MRNVSSGDSGEQLYKNAIPGGSHGQATEKKALPGPWTGEGDTATPVQALGAKTIEQAECHVGNQGNLHQKEGGTHQHEEERSAH